MLLPKVTQMLSFCDLNIYDAWSFANRSKMSNRGRNVENDKWILTNCCNFLKASDTEMAKQLSSYETHDDNFPPILILMQSVMSRSPDTIGEKWATFGTPCALRRDASLGSQRVISASCERSCYKYSATKNPYYSCCRSCAKDVEHSGAAFYIALFPPYPHIRLNLLSLNHETKKHYPQLDALNS